ncbi:MFS transporter [Mobilitalea sibirica]|uniref:MFS transporter n=1 Tax=Mobilitalea sibirica TaxID=1462919 RepID=A0A8J7GZG1_9FIRM|nr:MFS transporter [Mobilitalea sibirica]MBH1941259.1 MFS transporter [Mobilitalea sibirica]
MKLNYKRTFFVGLAFLSICAFWELYDNVVPKMLEKSFNMGETAAGVVMAMDNVLALLLLPLFGAFSDKVNTRLGKRTPFILIGTIVASVFILLLPVAEQQGSLVLFLISLGMVLIAMGSYRSPAVALMPDLTPKPLRSKANAVINLMGTLGGAYALLVIRTLYTEKEGTSKLPVFLAVVGLMILAVVLLLITIREKKLTKELRLQEQKERLYTEDENQSDIKMNHTEDIGAHTEEINETEDHKMPVEVRRSFAFIMASIFLWFFAYNAVKTAFSRYAEKVWGFSEGGFADPLLIALGAALISYIPIGIISSKIGRKKTIIAGIILMTMSYFLGFMVLEYSITINLIFAFTGIGWAAINVNSYPMVVEMSKSSNVGRYTGLYYTFSMSAQIITPILSGFLLENISYRTLFPYAVTFSLASLCTMLFVKHGDSKPLKKVNVIENYDTPD